MCINFFKASQKQAAVALSPNDRSQSRDVRLQAL